MTKSELITFARTKIGEDTSNNELSDTHLGTFLNARYQDVCNKIIDTNESHFLAIDQTIDLVSGTDNYSLPDLDADSRTKVIRILRLEIAYDGTNLHKAAPINIQDLPNSNDVDARFSTLSPAYYLLDDSIYLLPTPTANATNAVKIWYVQRQVDLANDDDVPQLPEQYHPILGWGIAADAMERSGAPVLDMDDIAVADRFESKYQEGLSDLLETLRPRDASHPVYVRDDSSGYMNPMDYERRSSIT